MPRFYTTLTWDDWPEGGSFGGVYEAPNQEDALNQAKREMAKARAEERAQEGESIEGLVDQILEEVGDDWHEVDCFDLDHFIECHQKPAVPRAEVSQDDDGPAL